MSPRSTAGLIDPDKTTTTGLSLSVITIKVFQIIKAEKTTIARLRSWKARTRLFLHNDFKASIFVNTIGE
jgi:hypothetical protein